MQMQHVKANNRILYFDALECLAIFLVISVHSCWLNGNVLAGISMSLYPLAVPVFFQLLVWSIIVYRLVMPFVLVPL